MAEINAHTNADTDNKIINSRKQEVLNSVTNKDPVGYMSSIMKQNNTLINTISSFDKIVAKQSHIKFDMVLEEDEEKEIKYKDYNNNIKKGGKNKNAGFELNIK